MKDGTHLYEVEHRAEHAARPGFRITELRISLLEDEAIRLERTDPACGVR